MDMDINNNQIPDTTKAITGDLNINSQPNNTESSNESSDDDNQINNNYYYTNLTPGRIAFIIRLTDPNHYEHLKNYLTTRKQFEYFYATKKYKKIDNARNIEIIIMIFVKYKKKTKLNNLTIRNGLVEIGICEWQIKLDWVKNFGEPFDEYHS